MATALLCPTVGAAASAFELAVVSQNRESDADTTVERVAKNIARIPASYVWSLSKFNASNVDAYQAAVGQDCDTVRATTGRSNLLAIVHDPRILAVVSDPVELSDADGFCHPLLTRNCGVTTGGNALVVANHLQRGNALTRQAQAHWLNHCAADLTESDASPAILLLGDFNFDFEPDQGAGNTAFDLFLEGDVFRWVRPACLNPDT